MNADENEIVFEGVLTKKGDLRHFVLQKKYLSWAKERNGFLIGQIPTCTMLEVKHIEKKNKGLNFDLKLQASRKEPFHTFDLTAATPEEAKKWVSVIERFIGGPQNVPAQSPYKGKFWKLEEKQRVELPGAADRRAMAERQGGNDKLNASMRGRSGSVSNFMTHDEMENWVRVQNKPSIINGQLKIMKPDPKALGKGKWILRQCVLYEIGMLVYKKGEAGVQPSVGSIPLSILRDVDQLKPGFIDVQTSTVGPLYFQAKNEVEAKKWVDLLRKTIEIVNQLAIVSRASFSASRPSVVADESAGLLPGWQAVKMPDGNVYYQNKTLNKTQWEKPVASSAPVPAANSRAGPPTPNSPVQSRPQPAMASSPAAKIMYNGRPLQANWEPVRMADGRVYFQNKLLKKTQWTPPFVEDDTPPLPPEDDPLPPQPDMPEAPAEDDGPPVPPDPDDDPPVPFTPPIPVFAPPAPSPRKESPDQIAARQAKEAALNAERERAAQENDEKNRLAANAKQAKLQEAEKVRKQRIEDERKKREAAEEAARKQAEIEEFQQKRRAAIVGNDDDDDDEDADFD